MPVNRAVAVSHVRGPAAALVALDAIDPREPLEGYHLFHAVRAEFEARLGRFDTAAIHLRRAIELTEVKSERQLLERRLAECEALASSEATRS